MPVADVNYNNEGGSLVLMDVPVVEVSSSDLLPSFAPPPSQVYDPSQAYHHNTSGAFGAFGPGPAMGYDRMQVDASNALGQAQVGALFGAQRFFTDAAAFSEQAVPYVTERATAPTYDPIHTTLTGSATYALGFGETARNMTDQERQQHAIRDLGERAGVVAGIAGAEVALPWWGFDIVRKMVGGPLGMGAGLAFSIGSDMLINADVYRDHLARGSFLESTSGRYIRPGVSRDFDNKGFSRSEVGELTRFIEDAGFSDAFFSPEEIDELTREFTFSGVFDAARSVDDFKKRFGEAKENLQLIMKEMGSSIDEGLGVMQELSALGITAPSEVRSTIESVKDAAAYAGISSDAAFDIATRSGMQTFMGTGIDLSLGVGMATSNLTRLGIMESRQTIDQETLRQLGGVAGAANTLTQVQGRLLQSEPVRHLMQAAYRGGEHVDLEVIGRALSGELSGGALGRMARQTLLGDETNPYAFEGQYDELLESMPEPVVQAMAAFPLIERALTLKRNHPRLNIDEDMLQGIAIRDLGFDRNTADLMVASLTDLDSAAIQEHQDRLRQQARAQEKRTSYSGYDWFHPIDSTVLFGRRLANTFIYDPMIRGLDAVSEWTQNTLNEAVGRAEVGPSTLNLSFAGRQALEQERVMADEVLRADAMRRLVGADALVGEAGQRPLGTIHMVDDQGASQYFDTGQSVMALLEADTQLRALQEQDYRRAAPVDEERAQQVADLFRQRTDETTSEARRAIEFMGAVREVGLGTSDRDRATIQAGATTANYSLDERPASFASALTTEQLREAIDIQESQRGLADVTQSLRGEQATPINPRLFPGRFRAATAATPGSTEGVFTIVGGGRLDMGAALSHVARDVALAEHVDRASSVVGSLPSDWEAIIQAAETAEGVEDIYKLRHLTQAIEETGYDPETQAGRALLRRGIETYGIDPQQAYADVNQDHLPARLVQRFGFMVREQGEIYNAVDTLDRTLLTDVRGGRQQRSGTADRGFFPELFNRVDAEVVEQAIENEVLNLTPVERDERGNITNIDQAEIFRGRRSEFIGNVELQKNFDIINEHQAQSFKGAQILEGEGLANRGDWLSLIGRLAVGEFSRGPVGAQTLIDNDDVIVAARRETIEGRLQDVNVFNRHLLDAVNSGQRTVAQRVEGATDRLREGLGLLTTSSPANEAVQERYKAYIADRSAANLTALRSAVEGVTTEETATELTQFLQHYAAPLEALTEGRPTEPLLRLGDQFIEEQAAEQPGVRVAVAEGLAAVEGNEAIQAALGAHLAQPTDDTRQTLSDLLATETSTETARTTMALFQYAQDAKVLAPLEALTEGRPTRDLAALRDEFARTESPRGAINYEAVLKLITSQAFEDLDPDRDNANVVLAAAAKTLHAELGLDPTEIAGMNPEEMMRKLNEDEGRARDILGQVIGNFIHEAGNTKVGEKVGYIFQNIDDLNISRPQAVNAFRAAEEERAQFLEALLPGLKDTGLHRIVQHETTHGGRISLTVAPSTEFVSEFQDLLSTHYQRSLMEDPAQRAALGEEVIDRTSRILDEYESTMPGLRDILDKGPQELLDTFFTEEQRQVYYRHQGALETARERLVSKNARFFEAARRGLVDDATPGFYTPDERATLRKKWEAMGLIGTGETQFEDVPSALKGISSLETGQVELLFPGEDEITEAGTLSRERQEMERTTAASERIINANQDASAVSEAATRTLQSSDAVTEESRMIQVLERLATVLERLDPTRTPGFSMYGQGA